MRMRVDLNGTKQQNDLNCSLKRCGDLQSTVASYPLHLMYFRREPSKFLMTGQTWTTQVKKERWNVRRAVAGQQSQEGHFIMH